MAGLSETLGRLAQLRAKMPQHSMAPASDRLTDFEDFGTNPGNLRARLYTPPSIAPGAPLVVVLHGCTQTAAGYDAASGWSQLADRFGFALLFPEQRRANNPNLCFNWFLPQHIRRGSGEPLSIMEMIEAVHHRHATDPQRVFVTGLSAGGAMTSVMLATYPEAFAGGAIIAGLPYGVAQSMPQAFEAMRGQGNPDAGELAAKLRAASDHDGPWPTISIWHGSSDATVSAGNARAILDQWLGVHRLPASPAETRMVSGFPRRVWRNERGRELVEEFIIPDMGHGTPIAPSGEDGYGASAPYMLDVGISSTQEICRFWGLGSSKGANKATPVAAPRLPAKVSPAPTEPRASQPSRDDRRPAKPPVLAVQKVIEDALRAAGLMK